MAYLFLVRQDVSASLLPRPIDPIVTWAPVATGTGPQLLPGDGATFATGIPVGLAHHPCGVVRVALFR